jgi:antitoxin component of MazEF toxin-antitoxin module
MVKTLTRHGNSFAVVIDKPILDLLGITPQTPLSIVTDGTSLVISPVVNANSEAKFQAAIAKGHKRYGRVFKRLAQ